MDPRFHKAQAALAAGDVAEMTALLAADPDLARAHSQCSHPTILQCLVLTIPPVPALEELISLLADHGAELTAPLTAAAGSNNVRAVAKLLDLGARIEGDGAWSPLEEGLYWGNQDAVSLLLARGAAATNLRTAAGLGDMAAIARCFDDRGALTAAAGEVASPFRGMAIPEAVRRDRQQILENALVFAAAWGRAAAVDLLIARGARVNEIPAGFDFSGTPLHYAALHGRRDMVDHLLAHGADPAVTDTKIGKLPEDWAAHDGDNQLASYLRDRRQQAPAAP